MTFHLNFRFEKRIIQCLNEPEWKITKQKEKYKLRSLKCPLCKILKFERSSFYQLVKLLKLMVKNKYRRFC